MINQSELKRRVISVDERKRLNRLEETARGGGGGGVGEKG